ncbi:hypothetical protein [Streptomyces sp. DH37]|uniref:hypothetical protein n=1 Tax=Streptomyces sp. DH37 TaxID=3040122 RepID=UPI00244199FA|nr:hypothetical protein [Streptomyces sp. DH37]MDG9702712.1 hypothetical protein [Streptomyces sp. DH37]
MNQLARTALVLAGAGAGAAVLRRAASSRRDARHGDRWLVVTINRAPTDVMPHDTPPRPLDEFGDALEITVRPAPGDRGTELAARLRDPASPASTSLPSRLAGKDPRQEVRRALREAKSLLETGEVMLPDAPPTGRSDTVGGKVVGLASKRAGGEGVL